MQKGGENEASPCSRSLLLLSPPLRPLRPCGFSGAAHRRAPTPPAGHEPSPGREPHPGPRQAHPGEREDDPVRREVHTGTPEPRSGHRPAPPPATAQTAPAAAQTHRRPRTPPPAATNTPPADANAPPAAADRLSGARENQVNQSTTPQRPAPCNRVKSPGHSAPYILHGMATKAKQDSLPDKTITQITQTGLTAYNLATKYTTDLTDRLTPATLVADLATNLAALGVVVPAAKTAQGAAIAATAAQNSALETGYQMLSAVRLSVSRNSADPRHSPRRTAWARAPASWSSRTSRTAFNSSSTAPRPTWRRRRSSASSPRTSPSTPRRSPRSTRPIRPRRRRGPRRRRRRSSGTRPRGRSSAPSTRSLGAGVVAFDTSPGAGAVRGPRQEGELSHGHGEDDGGHRHQRGAGRVRPCDPPPRAARSAAAGGDDRHPRHRSRDARRRPPSWRRRRAPAASAGRHAPRHRRCPWRWRSWRIKCPRSTQARWRERRRRRPCARRTGRGASRWARR